jgi:hypothetical protein
LHWQARRNEHNLIGNPRNRLIDAPRNIAEPPRQRIVRNDAETDFIRNEDDMSPRLGQCLRQGRQMCLDIFFMEQQIVEPDGEAID